MATVGTLVFELQANIFRLQSDMAKARSTVETATAGIQSAINVAKGALAGLGIALSVPALVLLRTRCGQQWRAVARRTAGSSI
jgi:hypothetical protein